ncbi:hypothetical protein PIB30_065177, partial [Stylosanthes scabra]|nr:hypothetical protein [Stylosanthes scabra]
NKNMELIDLILILNLNLNLNLNPEDILRYTNNNNKSPNAAAEEFLNRFQKNATLVAVGVVKDLNKVGNFVKETLVDILNRRPK